VQTAPAGPMRKAALVKLLGSYPAAEAALEAV
jgi:hypothetical protein